MRSFAGGFMLILVASNANGNFKGPNPGVDPEKRCESDPSNAYAGLPLWLLGSAPVQS